MKDTTNLKIALAASLTKTILWSNVKAKQRMMKFSYLNWQPWSTLSIKINIDPLVECEGRCHHFLLLISKRTSKWQKPWKGKVPSTIFQLCCSCQNGQQCTLGHMHNAIFCDGAEVNTSSPKGKTRESRQTPKMTLNHFVDSEAILQLGTTRDSVFQKQVNATKYTLSRIHFRAALAFKQTRH